MAPRISWIAFGVFFVFLTCQNVFCTKLHLLKQKAKTVSPAKKNIVGNIDLKLFAKRIKPEDCKNIKSKEKCRRIMQDTEHACLLNFQFMADKCKLSCRFCSPITKEKKKKLKGKCKDLHKKCGAWAKAGDCLHYVGFMMDVCRKSCEICGEDDPSVSDTDERCPKWGKAGFCGIKKRRMEKMCPHSCKRYASRRYTVKYAKPPKRRHPHPTRAPKPTKPTPRPTPPMSEEEKLDLKEAMEEFAEEEETRLKEKEEQRKQKDEIEEVTPLQAPPVVSTATQNPEPIPAPIPAPALSPDSLNDLNIDVPSEYEGGEPQTEAKKRTSI